MKLTPSKPFELGKGPRGMDASDWSVRQGHRLLQVGMLLFLCALLVGRPASFMIVDPDGNTIS